LVLEDQPDPADVAALEERLSRFTFDATGHHDLRELAVFVRDAAGTVVAGIYGWTWGGCCELAHLWVDEAERGRGWGGRLLDAAEAEARRRGCAQVVLFTHGVQAAAMYPPRGYELVGQVDGYPAGDRALWYRKRFDSDRG
jgi:GNAT superfamily N-acetyltransferase